MTHINQILSLILSALLLINGSVFAADKVFYYHTDPVGTPLAMTDSIGNVLWQADYRPFGEEQEAPGLIDNDRTFVGKEKDKESGLHYFGARYLKDDIGRFLAVDPVGAIDARSNTVNEKLLLNPQRLNAYAYALNNPYRYVDADGAFAIRVGADGQTFTLSFRDAPTGILGWLARLVSSNAKRAIGVGAGVVNCAGGASVSYDTDGVNIRDRIKLWFDEPSTDQVFEGMLSDDERKALSGAGGLDKKIMLAILEKLSKTQEYKDMNYPAPQEMISRALSNHKKSAIGKSFGGFSDAQRAREKRYDEALYGK